MKEDREEEKEKEERTAGNQWRKEEWIRRKQREV